jgi:hypothetical protein
MLCCEYSLGHSRKNPHSPSPPQRKFLLSGGGEEKNLFLIIVRASKGGRGLTSNFLVEEVWMFTGMT